MSAVDLDRFQQLLSDLGDKSIALPRLSIVFSKLVTPFKSAKEAMRALRKGQ